MSDNFPSDREFLQGDSEMTLRTRQADWAATPLGDPATWPQSLKTVVRLMLSSRYAMWMGWGDDLRFFYNDAYRPTLGLKHDWALGAPAARVWAEIWPEVRPLIDEVLSTGRATWNEGLLLFLERSGVPEETYHTFSYSPLFDDHGRAEGLFCVVTEETQRVIAERRIASLGQVASTLAATQREQELIEALGRSLGANDKDLPFTLTYFFDDDAPNGRLVSATGFADGAVPAALRSPTLDAPWPWPLGDMLKTGAAVHVDTLDGRVPGEWPRGHWPAAPRAAVLLPIRVQGQERVAGCLVAGLNPYRPFDADYASFLDLLASQLGGALSNARAYEEAQRRAEALAQIDRAKTTFFSNVSHEFRTPLTLMLGPLEDLLGDASLVPAWQDRLLLIQRNGVRLQKLVNSLLDFSRIEAGRVQASYVPADLALLTAELASNFRSATEKAGLALDVDCVPIASGVYVDVDMWEKIVLNLLSNAFKFTFEGRIAVRLHEDNGQAVLEVEDTGTGIPPHELPRMFERFHRVEGSRGRSFEGSGIGLALVQELVRLHGGEISVASELDRGTTFTVRIPLGRQHLPAQQVVERAPSAPPGKGAAYVSEALSWLDGGVLGAATLPGTEMTPTPAPLPGNARRSRVLVADDNADMRAYVARLLGVQHDCIVVPDGQAALDAARAERPDLVLTDIMMPRLDGIGLIQALRGDARLRDVPIIALSARAGEEASIEGRATGADDYLVKPFSARELLARVEAALAIARIRREAGEALRESEERFRNLADNAPVMIWMTDAEGRCIYLSEPWYAYTAQTPDTGLGFGWLDATHPDDKAEASRVFLQANARRESFELEYRLRRHDGIYRWHLDAAAPWRGADGEFRGYIGSVIDIDVRKEMEAAQRRLNEVLEQRVADAMRQHQQAEAELRQAHKMEAVGKLTGGVAHDFNNLLQVISGNLHILKREVVGNERAQARIAKALEGVARGAKLSQQMLAFGRRQPLAPKVIHLGRLIRNMDDMLRRALGEGVEIETVVAGGLWNTFVDSAQLENALLNLAINGRDAMDGHGRLTLEAGNAYLDDAYVQKHPEATAGQYVMVSVTDTGSGIAPEIVDKVFEPFFTTKAEGKGTGLGLSMVYGFVKQSGGHVKIYSEPGHGTTVRLYLPRSHEREDMVAEVDNGPIKGGSETVLVVEDDDDVRTTVVDLLADLGYRVLKASDAASALAIIDSGMAIDLLFTDVVMPGPLRSPDLARKARERLPELAVLFTSGYTENAIVHGGRLDPGVEMLSKPYTRESLARKLRHVLQGRG